MAYFPLSVHSGIINLSKAIAVKHNNNNNNNNNLSMLANHLAKNVNFSRL